MAHAMPRIYRYFLQTRMRAAAIDTGKLDYLTDGLSPRRMSTSSVGSRGAGSDRDSLLPTWPDSRRSVNGAGADDDASMSGSTREVSPLWWRRHTAINVCMAPLREDGGTGTVLSVVAGVRSPGWCPYCTLLLEHRCDYNLLHVPSVFSAMIARHASCRDAAAFVSGRQWP